MDVFLVISGFLITGILMRELESGRFSLAGFYARRVRRIFPALLLVLTCSLGAGWWWLSSDELRQLGKHVAGGAGSVANLLYWQESGYFDRASEGKPLLHLWSLGIEEQFYIFWPCCLYALHRGGRNVLHGLLLCAVASFCWNVWQVQQDPVAGFYSPLGRAWELLAGAALAVWRPGALVHRARARQACSVLGTVVLFGAVALLDPKRRFPGAWALLPVAGTWLVIAAGPQAWLNRSLWSAAPMLRIGRLSYSWYLWHWPLLALAFAVEGDQPTATYRTGAVLASLVLAQLSLQWVEAPARRGGPRPRLVLGLSIGMLCAGLVGLGLYWSDGFPSRAAEHDPRRLFLKQYRDLHEQGLQQAYLAECDFYDWATQRGRASIPAPCTQPGRLGTVFLWGDSHAQALSWGLRQTLPQGWRLAQVATSACKPSADPGGFEGLAGTCEPSNRYAMSQIRTMRPDVVVLAQSDHHDETDWHALAERLKAAGAKQVVLVGPTPQWKPALPLVITRYHWSGPSEWISTGLDHKILDTDRRLRERYGAGTSPRLVSLIGVLCRSEGACRARVPGGPDATLLVLDYGHLTPEASVFVAREIVLPALQLPPGSSP